MSARDDEDNLTDEDDESDDGDDEDAVYDEDDDAGMTGENNQPEEKAMTDATDKPNTEAKPAAPKAPPARRAPMGLLGTRPAAQAAKPQASAKPTIQAAVPPQAGVTTPPAMPDLAKDGIEFTEEKFAAYLAKYGGNIADFADIRPVTIANLVRRWANEAIETGVSPVDAWISAATKLIETAGRKLSDKSLDKAAADKLTVVARYFFEAVIQTRKPTTPANKPLASAKKTELGMAPPAIPVKPVEPKPAPAKVEETKPAVVASALTRVEVPKPVPAKVENPATPTVICPRCGFKNQETFKRCLSCGTTLFPDKKPTTDPHAATEVGTPMPGVSKVATGTGANSGRTTITPEQEAMVAAAAAAIKDEQSASIPAPPMPAPVEPVHPEAKVAVARQIAELGARARAEPKAFEPFRYGSAPRLNPFMDPDPPKAAAKVEAAKKAEEKKPAEPAKKAEEPRTGRVTKIQALTFFIAGIVLAILVWEFVIPKLQSGNTNAQPAVTQTAAPTPAPTIAPAPSPAPVETCTKVTSALLQKHYGQSDPETFRFEEKLSVRIWCGKKTIYQNPDTSLWDIRPCDICYK